MRSTALPRTGSRFLSLPILRMASSFECQIPRMDEMAAEWSPSFGCTIAESRPPTVLDNTAFSITLASSGAVSGSFNLWPSAAAARKAAIKKIDFTLTDD